MTVVQENYYLSQAGTKHLLTLTNSPELQEMPLILLEGDFLLHEGDDLSVNSIKDGCYIAVFSSMHCCQALESC